MACSKWVFTVMNMEQLKSINDAILRDVEISAAESKGAFDFASSIGSGITFIFDIGNLLIENPFTLQCDSGVAVNPSSIIGCSITASYKTNTEFVLVFDGRISLSISLREEDFIGPEAAVFRFESGDVVIID